MQSELEKYFGTKEFAGSNENTESGCRNGCIYCYARANSNRFKHHEGDWTEPVLNEKTIRKGFRRRGGGIMFPTSHDIYPENLDICIRQLQKMLLAGNDVLVVSKFHPAVAERVAFELAPFRSQMVIRATITSADPDTLSYWEPHAPPFQDRLSALKHLYENGFQTSVLIEPLLDPDPYTIVSAVTPFVNHSIWIGRMNQGVARLSLNGFKDPDMHALARVLRGGHDVLWAEFHETLAGNPLIRWKGESTRNKDGVS